MYKLLLVDDEQIIREGLARMIDWEGLGLTLTASCSNALAALDSMTDDMPDILLADVRMPGMDGLELVERAMALHPQLQAIILSGYDTFQYAQQAIKTGVMEYLLKPCSQEELTSALERACRAVDRQPYSNTSGKPCPADSCSRRDPAACRHRRAAAKAGACPGQVRRGPRPAPGRAD